MAKVCLLNNRITFYYTVIYEGVRKIITETFRQQFLRKFIL